MTMEGSTHTQADPGFDPDSSWMSEDDARARHSLFRGVTESSAAPRILGVTTVALSGSPRLAVRAALALMRDSRASRASTAGVHPRLRLSRRG
jgi:hypothetical protein